MFLTYTYAILFYLAVAVFVIGVGRKIYQYATTPAPLKIPTTPAPTTTSGVVLRMFREVVFFESLFKATKWTWLFGWMFHIALLLAFIRHLRYVVSTDSILGLLISLDVVQSFGKYASFALLFGLAGLFVRRIFVDRVRYISSPSDYLMLILLFGIAGSGAMMTFVARVDVTALKAFVLSLIYFDFNYTMHPLPDSLLLLAHLGMVIVLLFVFPISKLLHAPGVFFSPTRNQADNPREKRHLCDWAAQLESSGSKPQQ